MPDQFPAEQILNFGLDLALEYRAAYTSWCFLLFILPPSPSI